ncbi:MAG: hypothetical protein ABL876_02760 [Chitinophagaceae bacterium]
MTNLQVTPDGNLEIIPSKTSAAGDFDFFVGNWQIRNKKLKTRLNNCTEWTEFTASSTMFKTLNGIGNMDRFITIIDGKPFEGMTVRLFNPLTRLWSIYWADSNKGILDVPVVGSFENNTGMFYTKDAFNGRDILVAFNWDKTNPDEPIWSQAFPDDNGITWEWNWYMYMKRVK